MAISRVSQVEVTDQDNRRRIDNFLLGLFKNVPKALVYKLIRSGQVRVNSGRIAPSYRLRVQDKVRIPPVHYSAAPVVRVSDQLRSLLNQAVLFEDDWFCVLNKPVGLAVHTGTSLSVGLIEAFRIIRPKHDWLGLVHRLDRGTSGCLLLSKHKSLIPILQKQFAAGTDVQKYYHCIVHGQWPHDITQAKNRLLYQKGRQTEVTDESGQSAWTKYRFIESVGMSHSLVEARPMTGRTHQIRAHCLQQTYPIVGDQKYTTPQHRACDLAQDIEQLCLHAYQLQLTHPVTGQALNFQAKYSAHFNQVLDQLRA